LKKLVHFAIWLLIVGGGSLIAWYFKLTESQIDTAVSVLSVLFLLPGLIMCLLIVYVWWKKRNKAQPSTEGRTDR
jgi:hypothetical protein